MIKTVAWVMVLFMNGEPQFQKSTALYTTEAECIKAADAVNAKLLKNEYAVRQSAFYACGEVVRPEGGKDASKGE